MVGPTEKPTRDHISKLRPYRKHAARCSAYLGLATPVNPHHHAELNAVQRGSGSTGGQQIEPTGSHQKFSYGPFKCETYKSVASAKVGTPQAGAQVARLSRSVQEYPGVSRSVQERPGASRSVEECPGAPGASRSVQVRSGASRSVQERPGASKSVQDCPGAPGASRSVQECPGVSRSVQGCPGVSRSVQECPGASRSVQERPGVPKSVQDCPGAPGVSQGVRTRCL